MSWIAIYFLAGNVLMVPMANQNACLHFMVTHQRDVSCVDTKTGREWVFPFPGFGDEPILRQRPNYPQARR